MVKNLALALATLVSCSPDPTPPLPKAAPDPNAPTMMSPAGPVAVDLIKFDPPAAWVKEEPSSAMRKAQYKVPGKDKKGADASLALFYFGPRNDMLEDNIKRWAQQMGAADPKPEVIQGKCKVTFVDLKGTYTGDQHGGQNNDAVLHRVFSLARRFSTRPPRPASGHRR